MSSQAPSSLPAAPPSPTGLSSLGDMVLFPSGSAHGKGFSGALPSEKEVVGPLACMDQGTSHRAIEATGQKEHARKLWHSFLACSLYHVWSSALGPWDVHDCHCRDLGTGF